MRPVLAIPGGAAGAILEKAVLPVFRAVTRKKVENKFASAKLRIVALGQSEHWLESFGLRWTLRTLLYQQCKAGLSLIALGTGTFADAVRDEYDDKVVEIVMAQQAVHDTGSDLAALYDATGKALLDVIY